MSRICLKGQVRTILGAFVVVTEIELQSCYICSPVCLHVHLTLHMEQPNFLDKFSCNFLLEMFAKISRTYSILVQMVQK